MKIIESLWENDKLGLKTAINHVAVTGTSWNSFATSPLMTAIDQGNSILVLKLLDAGAKPSIDFDSWLQGAKFSFESQLGVGPRSSVPLPPHFECLNMFTLYFTISPSISLTKIAFYELSAHA